MTSTSSPRARSKGRRWRGKIFRPVRNFLVGALGPPLLYLWMATLRCRWVGDAYLVDGLPSTPTRGVVAFWHQSLLSLAGLFRNSGTRVVISSHGDGEMIARIVENLGMQAVRGSSTRGGSRALLAILREDGWRHNIAITPDGPRGPNHHFHSGAVYLASRTGLPLYLVAVAYERYRALPTWDGFMLPCPFSRVVVRLGETYQLETGLDREGLEAKRQEIERRLQELTRTTRSDFAGWFARGKRHCELRPPPPLEAEG